MNNKQNNEFIYPITVEDLQNDAINRIGRKLTDDELCSAKKYVEMGLSSIIDITMNAAIKEAVAQNVKTDD
jgi:hypothetical protein